MICVTKWCNIRLGAGAATWYYSAVLLRFVFYYYSVDTFQIRFTCSLFDVYLVFINSGKTAVL